MSMATDLGTGQPLEHALRTAILAVRLGDLAGLSPSALVDAYYISLLHSFGCTSDATEQTELFGDDIQPRAKSQWRRLLPVPPWLGVLAMP